MNNQGTVTYGNAIGTAPLVTGRWVVVWPIEVDHTVTPQLATFTYDGVVVVDRKPTCALVSAVGATIIVGSDFASPGPALRIDFDDLRVDITP